MRRKNRTGYLMLAILVISGLAGTVTDNSLTKKERKLALESMKSSRTAVFESLWGITEVQLRYQSPRLKYSISDFITQLATKEKTIWEILETTLNSTADPKERDYIKIKDEEIFSLLKHPPVKTETLGTGELENPAYNSPQEALTHFKNTRIAHMKYINRTTEDLRNHVAKTPLGWMDSYQICLLMSAYSNWFAQQIDEIRSEPGFPK